MITLDFNSLNIEFDDIPYFEKRFKAAHPKVDHHYVHGDQLHIFFDGSETQSDIDSAQAWVEAYDNLSDYKERRNIEIDQRTRELIISGTVYDGVTFSLSDNAQRNWIAIHSAVNLYEANNSYPVSVVGEIDGEHTMYQLNDASQVYAFTGHCLGVVSYWYQSGAQLKINIEAAATRAAVDAVVDNR